MNINFARLNHILLPDTKAGRDRFRRGFWGKVIAPATFLYEGLTDEGRLLAILSMVVGFFGLDVQATEVFLAWGAIVGLFAASFAVRRFYRMPGVHIEVACPRRVTVGEPMTFAITLRNEGERDAFAVRVRGPFLPWDGVWEGRVPAVRHLRGASEERVESVARFSARGEHHLDPFGASAVVPLGLAQGRPVWSTGVKFLVLPKIANVARVAAAMGRRHQPGGIALASKTGESMDLLGVRPYRPGDPVKHLHAKSWARVGRPVVREYQEEYFSRVGVVLDTGPVPERLLEASISLAAGLLAKLSRGEALIDLLVVGGELHDLTIGRNLGFLEQALDLLACVEPAKKAVTAEALLGRLAPHLPRLSAVFVVTARPDPELADRIRGHGTSCATVVVFDDDKGRPAPPAGDVYTMTVGAGAVERGEALSL